MPALQPPKTNCELKRQLVLLTLPEVPVQAASRHSTAQVHRVPKYRCLQGGNRRSERLLVQAVHLWFLAVPAPSQRGQMSWRASGLGDAQQPQQMKHSLHHPGTRINPCAEEVASTVLFFLDTSKDFSALLWWAKGNLLKNGTPAVIMDYMAISLKHNFRRPINSHREISRCNHWQKFNLRNFLIARKDSPAFPLISNTHICTVICTFFCQWENTCNTLLLATFTWSSMLFLKSITKSERRQWMINKTQPVLKLIKM